MHATIPAITIGDHPVPALGLGTWKMGEVPARAASEADALVYGLDLGMTLIDTAEMYGDGGAEQVVGVAIAGRRDAAYIVSKVYPWNAGYRQAIAACEKSLLRLGTDRLDLYLLHWRGDVPLEETVSAFTELKRRGLIGAWGVSNFDTADMEDLFTVAGGASCAANQVLYNLARRGVEHDLLPWCRNHDVAVMAYSPIDQGGILRHPVLIDLAKTYQATPAQVALAFLLRQGVVAIPKSASKERIAQNRASVDLAITAADWAEVDRSFPPPRRKQPLEML